MSYTKLFLQEVNRMINKIGGYNAEIENEFVKVHNVGKIGADGKVIFNDNNTSDHIITAIAEQVEKYIKAYVEGEELNAKEEFAGYRKVLDFGEDLIAMKRMVDKSYKFIVCTKCGDNLQLEGDFSLYCVAREYCALRRGIMDAERIANTEFINLIHSYLMN